MRRIVGSIVVTSLASLGLGALAGPASAHPAGTPGRCPNANGGWYLFHTHTPGPFFVKADRNGNGWVCRKDIQSNGNGRGSTGHGHTVIDDRV